MNRDIKIQVLEGKFDQPCNVVTNLKVDNLDDIPMKLQVIEINDRRFIVDDVRITNQKNSDGYTTHVTLYVSKVKLVAN